MSLGNYILRKTSWTVSENYTRDYKKYVMIIAPHTSYWDFLWGKLLFGKLKLSVRFLIKKQMFFFPLGPIIKSWGAIPVDKSKNNNILDTVKDLFEKNQKMIIAITPEGTRKATDKWKRGFYHIAKRANVPIAIATLDYKKKHAEIQKIFHPSEISMAEVIKELRIIYKGVNAKFPEDFCIPKA